jgi:hypothetical protein
MRKTVVTFLFLVLPVLGACGGPVEAVDQASPDTSSEGLCTPDYGCEPRLCIEPDRQGWSYFADAYCTGTEYGMTDANGLKVTWDGQGCLGLRVNFTYRSLRDSQASGGFCWNYGTPITHPSLGYRIRR